MCILGTRSPVEGNGVDKPVDLKLREYAVVRFLRMPALTPQMHQWGSVG